MALNGIYADMSPKGMTSQSTALGERPATVVVLYSYRYYVILLNSRRLCTISNALNLVTLDS